jgi:hypothetical protein
MWNPLSDSGVKRPAGSYCQADLLIPGLDKGKISKAASCSGQKAFCFRFLSLPLHL